MGLAPALYALYASSKVKDACRGRAPGVGISLRLQFQRFDPKVLPAGWDVALPVITSLSIFLRHQPLAQLSFQCWGQKMPSPDEFSRHRLRYSYLESRLPFMSSVWDSCNDE